MPGIPPFFDAVQGLTAGSRGSSRSTAGPGRRAGSAGRRPGRPRRRGRRRSTAAGSSRASRRTARNRAGVLPPAAIASSSVARTCVREALAARCRHPAGGRARVDAGAEQALVRVDVADAGDEAVIHERELDRRPPSARRRVQHAAGERAESGSTPRCASRRWRAGSPSVQSTAPKRRGSRSRTATSPTPRSK